jgi:hypothetical protein
MTLPQVHIACVELRESGDKLGVGVPITSDQALHLRDELGIGQACQGSEDVVLHIRL